MLSSAGWEHHPPVTEDCQEDSAGGGVEEDARGPEGHSRSAPAAWRKGQCPSEGGEARFHSTLRQFGTNISRPSRERDEKTTKCLQVSLNEKAASLPIWWLSCCKEQLLLACVEQPYLAF